MPDETLAILTDTDCLALSALTEALDGITADIVDARTYGGPDAHRHAQNQAQRELVALLVDLARAKRSEPDEPAYDDETPEHVQKRMAELERLVRDLYDPLRRVAEESIAPAWEEWAVLSRRACDLLDLEPPGSSFDPSTEGP